MKLNEPLHDALAVAVRHFIENYQVGDRRIYDALQEKLRSLQGEDYNALSAKQTQAILTLANFIITDVNDRNDGKMSEIGAKIALPKLCKLLGYPGKITPDHPLVDLIQTVRDAAHAELYRLKGQPAPASTVTIDVATLYAKSASRAQA